MQLVALRGVAAAVGLGQCAQLLEPVQLLGVQRAGALVGGQVAPVDPALHPPAAAAQHGAGREHQGGLLG